MMKPQDLMVGDLISMGGVIRVVTGIHDKETENGVDLITTMIPGHTFPDSNLSFRASYCYPIQITPEILKKNGFEYYHKNFASTDYDSPFKLEMVEWPDENGNGGLWLIKGLFKIRYVHELQHALRLCGIEKKIIL